MMRLRKIVQSARRLFEKGRPLERLYPLYEAMDTFAMTPGTTARTAPFIRDAIDLKRSMMFVIYALLPCLGFGIYNTGAQMLMAGGHPAAFFPAVWLGLGKVLPLMMTVYLAGGFWEVVFAVVRRHEINEGFLVTGMLATLIFPPGMPLWQAAVAVSFGVVIGKEIFGGVGFNILNPALTARAFAFFAYPAQMSGDRVWVAVDGWTQATPLSVLAEAPRGSEALGILHQAGYSFQDAFLGFIPGSIGETSTLACLFGLIFLLVTGIANWRIVAGCLLGLLGTGTVLMLIHGPNLPAVFSLPPYWHVVLGGFAFGAVFMATDPVSASATQAGRWIYGILIGMLVVLIRVFNPAYPEGVMLAILLMNIFAPLIDYGVVEHHIRCRTAARRAAGKS